MNTGLDFGTTIGAVDGTPGYQTIVSAGLMNGRAMIWIRCERDNHVVARLAIKPKDADGVADLLRRGSFDASKKANAEGRWNEMTSGEKP